MVKGWAILQTIAESLAGRMESEESCQDWELRNEREKRQRIDVGTKLTGLDEELWLARLLPAVFL